MALKAMKPVGTGVGANGAGVRQAVQQTQQVQQEPQYTQQAVQQTQQVQQEPQYTQQEVQETAAQSTAVANAQTSALSQPAPGSIADLNAGILEGVEDLESSGNFVSVDGTQFLYKALEETADYIDLVVSSGEKFYQWVDESDPTKKVFHNSPEKLNANYKVKFNMRWHEDRSNGEEEPIEFTHTLSTTSTLNFINNYLKPLGRRGLPVNAVVTRLTISRQVSKDKQNRYPRVEMEAFDLNEYQNGNLVPLGVKTPDAKTF